MLNCHSIEDPIEESKKDSKVFRLIAKYNPESEEHHFYLTNIPPETLNPSEIGICCKMGS